MESMDNVVFNAAAFIAGLFMLEYGADKFIDHTAVVAKRMHVSPTLVGLLTCGAEWEELVVIAVALGQKQPSLALGNLMGSSIANILASFSLGLLFMKSATFDKSSKIYAAVLFASTSLFLLFLYTLHGTLKRIAGGLLIVAFVVYVASVASLIYRGTLTPPEDDSDDSDSDSDRDSDSDSDSDNDGGYSSDKTDADGGEDGRRRSKSAHGSEGQAVRLKVSSRIGRLVKDSATYLPLKTRPKSLGHHLVRLLIGLGALLVASYIVAHSAASIGSALGLSETVVGTTILSLATTLPEKFVAIMGGVRKQPGILVANTVGSNIFLVTLCGGILFVGGNSGEMELGFTAFEALVMWASALLIFIVVLVGGKGWMGGLCLGLYVSFLVVEFAHGRKLEAD